MDVRITDISGHGISKVALRSEQPRVRPAGKLAVPRPIPAGVEKVPEVDQTGVPGGKRKNGRRKRKKDEEEERW